MQTFDGIPAINRAMRRYLVHAETQMAKKSATTKLSQDTFDRLEKLADSPSPVDAMVGTGELLYARRNELDSEGRQLAAGLMAFAYQAGFHGLRDDERGMRIAQSLDRDDGVEAPAGMTYPDAASDPAARPEYLAAVEAPPMVAPAVPPAQPPASDAPAA